MAPKAQTPCERKIKGSDVATRVQELGSGRIPFSSGLPAPYKGCEVSVCPQQLNFKFLKGRPTYSYLSYLIPNLAQDGCSGNPQGRRERELPREMEKCGVESPDC